MANGKASTDCCRLALWLYHDDLPDGGVDTLWLFYDEEQHPAFVIQPTGPTRQSRKPVWKIKVGKILPYYDKIVGVMWAESTAQRESYWFLLNDGNYLIYEIYSKTLELLPLKGSPWAPLEEYKSQNDDSRHQ
jgi:hypothetical protein